MQFTYLQLTQFKNHEEITFSFDASVVCFAGKNGAGKTNILDAIYLLCMSKSYFNAQEQMNIRHEMPYYSLAAKIHEAEDLSDVRCVVKRGGKKEFRFNKTPYERMADHVGKFPVVFIAPGDIALINDGSEERRRFMDAIIAQCDKTYLRELMRYNYLVESRNRQLKQFAERGYFDAALLETFDEQLTGPATYIFACRTAFVKDFLPFFHTHYQQLAGDSEPTAIHYLSDLADKQMEALLTGNLDRDLYAQRTTEGLHKDDLVLELNGFPVKKFGSQGQIKTFLIALKLAQFDYLKQKTAKKPFLLLDDIFEKLDEHRAAKLMQLVAEEHFGQIFITDTHRQRMEQIFASIGTSPQIFDI